MTHKYKMRILKSGQTQEKIFQLSLIGFFIGLSIIIRLYFFFLNRSLWLDEVYLSTSIVKMSLGDLLSKELFYFQKAPLGYLLAQKGIIAVFGASEMTLRLFSLLCSIASLFVFASVSKYFLKSKLVWLAVAIFAFAPPLVFHAVEAKPYMCDLLATLISFSLYIKYNQSNTVKQLVLWGLCGALLIWFSYPVIFVLTGMAVTICVENILKKKWNIFFVQLIPFSIWLLSFCINFLLVTQRHAESDWTVFWFDYYKYFAPIVPTNADDVNWYIMSLYWMLDYPLGFSLVFFRESMGFAPLVKLSVIGAIMLLIGFLAYIKNHRDFYILVIISMATLLASGLKMYPLKERFLVFFAPVFIWFIVSGCIYLAGFLKKKWQKSILCLLVLLVPAINIVYLILVPNDFLKQKKSYEKQALSFIQSNFKDGDVLYVYRNNVVAFELYRILHNYPIPTIIGKDHRGSSNNFNDYFRLVMTDLELLSEKKRVWLLYDDVFQSGIGEGIDWPAWYFKNGKPTDTVVSYFRSIATPIRSFKSSDAIAICFELR